MKVKTKKLLIASLVPIGLLSLGGVIAAIVMTIKQNKPWDFSKSTIGTNLSHKTITFNTNFDVASLPNNNPDPNDNADYRIIFQNDSFFDLYWAIIGIVTKDTEFRFWYIPQPPPNRNYNNDEVEVNYWVNTTYKFDDNDFIIKEIECYTSDGIHNVQKLNYIDGLATIS